MFQQDLDNADMTVPGCAVERSQLILQRDDEEGKQPVKVLIRDIRDRDENISGEDNRWGRH